MTRFRRSSRVAERVSLSRANAHRVSTAMLSAVANPTYSERRFPTIPRSGKYITNCRVARQGFNSSNAAERCHRHIHRAFVQDVEDSARCRQPPPRPSTSAVPVPRSGMCATMIPDAVRRGPRSPPDGRNAAPPEPAPFPGRLLDVGEGGTETRLVQPQHIPPAHPACVPATARTKSAMTFELDRVRFVSATITPMRTVTITAPRSSPTTLEFLAYNRPASGQRPIQELLRRRLAPPQQSSRRPPDSHTGRPAWSVTYRTISTNASIIAACLSSLTREPITYAIDLELPLVGPPRNMPRLSLNHISHNASGDTTVGEPVAMPPCRIITSIRRILRQ